MSVAVGLVHIVISPYSYVVIKIHTILACVCICVCSHILAWKWY